MTEAEYNTSQDPQRLLAFLRTTGAVSDRKLRLFACACCRRAWGEVGDQRSRSAVAAAEQFADGLLGEDELVAAGAAARAAREEAAAAAERALYHWWHTFDHRWTAGMMDLPDAEADYHLAAGAWAMAWLADWAVRPAGELVWDDQATLAFDVWHMAHRGPLSVFTQSHPHPLRDVPSGDYVRDLFGNPFRPHPAFDSSVLAWDNGLIPRLGQTAYEDRVLPEGTLDPARLAVLADALEEGGCTDAEALGHLRSPGPHVRGCWVVDLVRVRQ